MDSLTQIALGSAVTALIAPARYRRAALVAGGVLGTLPDLDVIPLTLSGADAVSRITWHRGPSHSLLVLAVTGWLLWLVLRRWWAPVKEAPTRWLWAIESALLTHPLLDAFTVYGTQLFWPLPGSPVMGASIFIIDPAYTVPLLVACGAAWWLRERRAANWWLLAGVLSEHGLPGLVADGQGHRRARGAAHSGRRRFAGRAAFLGAHAIQHPSLARSGDDAGWISGR